MISHFPKDHAVPSVDLIVCGITSPSNTDANKLCFRDWKEKVFLAHIAGINVGLRVEKYNTHFDCFKGFFKAKFVCVLNNVENVVIDASKRDTIHLLYVEYYILKQIQRIMI